jgi:hypothetical protein
VLENGWGTKNYARTSSDSSENSWRNEKFSSWSTGQKGQWKRPRIRQKTQFKVGIYQQTLTPISGVIFLGSLGANGWHNPQNQQRWAGDISGAAKKDHGWAGSRTDSRAAWQDPRE